MLRRIQVPTGPVRMKPTERFLIVPDSGPDGWALDCHHSVGTQVLTGEGALWAMTHIMAHMNHEGGSRKRIASAVNLIESIGDSHKLFRWVAQQEKKQEADWWRSGAGPGVHNIPAEIRLAMEMSANEENERIALEGELSLLEDAWKEAEEIAAIADNLVLPKSVEGGLLGLQHKRPEKPER